MRLLIFLSILGSGVLADNFQYYNSTTIVDEKIFDEYWSQEKEYRTSNYLSTSYRKAITIQLKFDFPFYGQLVRNVTVTTGGYMYTGEYIHSWLAATQYIAPLMANFDPSMSNVSSVKYCDNGTAFTVTWEKVPLQNERNATNSTNPAPLFTFSATLYNTGDITFAYQTIPIAIEMIQNATHPVKVGLSDAYVIDRMIYSSRRKTIYEYHRVNLIGEDIRNNTLITLKALPTCLEYKDCKSCMEAKLPGFNCKWCPTVNRCSTGTDRKRQSWLEHGCERSSIHDLKMCPVEGSMNKNDDLQLQVSTESSTESSED